jgi:hypothetical protein
LVAIEKIKVMYIAYNFSLITNEKIGYFEPHVTTSKLHNNGIVIFCGGVEL